MNLDWGMIGAIATIIGVFVTIVLSKKSQEKVNNKEGNKQKVTGFIVTNNEIKQENK